MKFITPIAVSTINTGRIQHNESLGSLLQHFHGSSQPANSDVSLQGVKGLVDGVLWSREYPASIRAYSSSTDTFNSSSLITVSCNTFSDANSYLISNYLEAGELVSIRDSDRLYLVDNTRTSLVQAGVYPDTPRTNANNALSLSGILASKFVVNSLDTTISANLILANSKSIIFSSGYITNSNSTAQIATSKGYLRSSNSALLDSSSIKFNGPAYRSYYELSGSNVTLECNSYSSYSITLTGDTTVNMANVPSMSFLQLKVTANNSYYIKWPFSVKWSNGIVPIPPTNNANSVYSLLSVDSGNTWYATSNFETT